MFAMFISGVLATLVLYFWARKQIAEKQLLLQKEENERLLEAAEELRRRKKSVQPKRDALERLCEQYYIYEGTENFQPKILREVKSIVEGFRQDPKVRQAIEEDLNVTYSDVMTKLRASYPRWKEEDFVLYAYSASGFSATTISTLLEKDKPYVYNHLYRMKERIRVSGDPNRELYLSLL